METGKMKNWIMIGLGLMIVVILLTQPVVVTNVEMTAFVSDDEMWLVNEPMRVDELSGVDNSYSQSAPSTDGEYIVFTEKSGSEYYVAYSEIGTGEFEYVHNVTGVGVMYQLAPSVYDGKIVWAENNDLLGSGTYDIWMKNLNDNVTSRITNGTGAERNPIIHGDTVVYYDDLDHSIQAHCLTNATAWKISGASYAGSYFDYDGEKVAMILAGDMYYYDFETNELVNTGVETASKPSISGDVIAYHTFDNVIGYWTTALYSIENDRAYSTMTDGMEGSFAPVVDDGLIVSLTEYAWTEGFYQISLLDTTMSDSLFDEQYSQFTNDSHLKANVDMVNGVIVWEQYDAILPFRASSAYEHDVMYVTFEAYEEAEITQEFQEQTVYNTDWIYAVLILGTAFAGFFTMWVGEEYIWKDKRYVR